MALMSRRCWIAPSMRSHLIKLLEIGHCTKWLGGLERNSSDSPCLMVIRSQLSLPPMGGIQDKSFQSVELAASRTTKEASLVAEISGPVMKWVLFHLMCGTLHVRVLLRRPLLCVK